MSPSMPAAGKITWLLLPSLLVLVMCAPASPSIVAAASSPQPTAAKARKMKNVLLLLVDDLRPEMRAAYGQNLMLTPAMDRLAETSTVFQRAYCQQVWRCSACARARVLTCIAGRLTSMCSVFVSCFRFLLSFPVFVSSSAVVVDDYDGPRQFAARAATLSCPAGDRSGRSPGAFSCVVLLAVLLLAVLLRLRPLQLQLSC